MCGWSADEFEALTGAGLHQRGGSGHPRSLRACPKRIGSECGGARMATGRSFRVRWPEPRMLILNACAGGGAAPSNLRSGLAQALAPSRGTRAFARESNLVPRPASASMDALRTSSSLRSDQTNCRPQSRRCGRHTAASSACYLCHLLLRRPQRAGRSGLSMSGRPRRSRIGE